MCLYVTVRELCRGCNRLKKETPVVRECRTPNKETCSPESSVENVLVPWTDCDKCVARNKNKNNQWTEWVRISICLTVTWRYALEVGSHRHRARTVILTFIYSGLSADSRDAFLSELQKTNSKIQYKKILWVILRCELRWHAVDCCGHSRCVRRIRLLLDGMKLNHNGTFV
jgi:hypothetical protein